MASLFERVPRRRGNRWPSEVEEKWEEEDVNGEGYGAVSCVFKGARNGRLLCRPELDSVFLPISSLFSVTLKLYFCLIVSSGELKESSSIMLAEGFLTY